MSNSTMDAQEARRLATRFVEDFEAEVGEKLDMQDHLTMETSKFFVFFYNTKEFIETGNISCALAGNGPLLVSKESGDVHIAGTDRPIEDYITELERG